MTTNAHRNNTITTATTTAAVFRTAAALTIVVDVFRRGQVVRVALGPRRVAASLVARQTERLAAVLMTHQHCALAQPEVVLASQRRQVLSPNDNNSSSQTVAIESISTLFDCKIDDKT